MSEAKRLTDAGLHRVSRPSSGRFELWDALAPGLGARVGSRKTSWFVMYRASGRVRRMTLGSFPALSVSEARERAREVRLAAERGGDPAAQPEAVEGAAVLSGKTTVADAVEVFIERYARPRQKSWRDTEAALRLSLVAIHGHRALRSLKRADIAVMLDSVTAKNGVTPRANRMLAHTRRFFNWLVERGVLETSPALGVKAPAKEIARDRVLSDDELSRVWRAAECDGYPFGPLVQLLILTGQRRSEVAGLRWDELEFETATWTMPAERTKGDRLHVVPLAEPAIDIIRALDERGRTGPLLFPAQNALAGERPVSGFKGVKNRLDCVSSVTDWRLHDLRRTAASGMARQGVNPHVVERVLNHATSSIGPLARVYQRYSYEAEKRAALAEWAAHVSGIMNVNY